jgi:uncharacterized protein (DUF885 family)
MRRLAALVLALAACDRSLPSLDRLPPVAGVAVLVAPVPPEPAPRDEAALRRFDEVVARFVAWNARPGFDAKQIRAIDAESAAIDASGLPSDARTRWELVRFHASLAVAWLDHRDAWKKLPRRTPLATLAEGPAAYRFAIREHTSLDATPLEIRDQGLDELAHIEAELVPLAARLGHGGDARAVFAELRAAPRPAAEMLAPAEAAQARAIAALPRAFAWTAVVAAPIHAFPENWSPPGWYVAAVGKPRRTPGFYLATGRTRLHGIEMEVLSTHETVPGHHYQHEAAVAAGHDPRAFGSITAFTEGWATYAERVADELGVFSSDEARLGMLCFQAWRASRVAIDTGLHAFGWTRDEARSFLRDHTALAEAVIDQEIGRSLGDPGHGLGYTIGERAFRALREEAEAALGPRFDLPALHQVMLAWGDVPLATLERRVREWIAAQQLRRS